MSSDIIVAAQEASGLWLAPGGLISAFALVLVLGL
jgi:hypothetical protein